MESVNLSKDKAHLMPEEITKKDINMAWVRWWFCNTIPQSVERYLAPALAWSLVPILRKLYKDDEKLKAALKRQLLFFNTQLSFGGIIVGLMASMEKERAHQEVNNLPISMTDDLIYNTKAGLMGALAGIGDSIDSGTIQYILIAIALPWTQQGLAIGALMPFIVFAGYQFLVGFWFTKQGYSMGGQAASLISGARMQSVIELLSILGLFMMGVLSANFVRVSSTLTVALGEGEYFVLQETLDQILPGVLPLTVVLGLYWYFVKKGLKVTTALVGLTIILAILAGIGIL